MRFDYIHQFAHSLGEPEQTSDNHAVSPRLGLVYQPVEPVSLYTSWTKGFQPSSPFGFNPDGQLFKPERSTQYEVGTKIFMFENRVSATLWSTYHVQKGPLKGFGLGGGIFAYSDRNASLFEEQISMPGYIRADAAVYYNRALEPGNWLRAKALNVALNIRNLLDKRYIATSHNGSQFFFFGESFTVLGTVGVRF